MKLRRPGRTVVAPRFAVWHGMCLLRLAVRLRQVRGRWSEWMNDRAAKNSATAMIADSDGMPPMPTAADETPWRTGGTPMPPMRQLGAAVLRSAMIAATLHLIESPTRERAEEARATGGR